MLTDKQRELVEFSEQYRSVRGTLPDRHVAAAYLYTTASAIKSLAHRIKKRTGQLTLCTQRPTPEPIIFGNGDYLRNRNGAETIYRVAARNPDGTILAQVVSKPPTAPTRLSNLVTLSRPEEFERVTLCNQT